MWCVQVTLHREKVTWPGAMIKKPGEGMPNYEDNTLRGSLYITIDVDFPRVTFSDDDKEGVCVLVSLCVDYCGESCFLFRVFMYNTV